MFFICPRCGAGVRPFDDYCYRCGYDVGSARDLLDGVFEGTVGWGIFATLIAVLSFAGVHILALDLLFMPMDNPWIQLMSAVSALVAAAMVRKKRMRALASLLLLASGIMTAGILPFMAGMICAVVLFLDERVTMF
ncbi:MAG: hypothetical protein MJZ68_03930 [archaeon]|nr:hypothetical protein [archaeon]